MPTLTEAVQARLRTLTGKEGQWTEDWHALFDVTVPTTASGQFGERLLAYYNAKTAPLQTNTVSIALNFYLSNPSSITL